jgi:hypothetical protein
MTITMRGNLPRPYILQAEAEEYAWFLKLRRKKPYSAPHTDDRNGRIVGVGNANGSREQVTLP